MEPAFWWAILTASIVGSLHCAGMCGPIAVMAAGCSSGRGRLDCSGAYQFGRLGSYLLLGLVAGSIGAALNLGGSFLGWQQSAAYLAGGTLIIVGLIALLRRLGVKVPHQRLPRWLTKLFQSCQRRIQKLTPRRRALLLGALTGALPCGWLYAFVMIAAGTAHPGSGLAVMAIFWFGSVPILTGISWSASWVLSRFQRQATWVTAVLLIIVGSLTVAQRTGWSLDTSDYDVQGGNKQIDADDIKRVTEETPACCQDNE